MLTQTLNQSPYQLTKSKLSALRSPSLKTSSPSSKRSLSVPTHLSIGCSQRDGLTNGNGTSHTTKSAQVILQTVNSTARSLQARWTKISSLTLRTLWSSQSLITSQMSSSKTKSRLKLTISFSQKPCGGPTGKDTLVLRLKDQLMSYQMDIRESKLA